jgi:dihydrofolate reductase
VRKLIVSEFLTLDGVMQAPGDPNEDRSGGFEHGGWHIPYAELDDVQMRMVGEGMAGTDAYLFGRRTYEIMAAHWPHQPDTDMFAAVLNPRTKYVVSTTLSEPLEWQNSTLISSDVPDAIRELKQQPGGNITVLGSGGLVQTLIEHDLVDEFGLMIDPIVLGTGKRLFRDGLPPTRLRVANSHTNKAGVVMLTYRRAETE